MSDNGFEEELQNVLKEAVNGIYNTMAEKMAKEIASAMIEEIEGTLTDAITSSRKPLIYMKIIKEIEKHIEKISGKLTVKEEGETNVE